MVGLVKAVQNRLDLFLGELRNLTAFCNDAISHAPPAGAHDGKGRNGHPDVEHAEGKPRQRENAQFGRMCEACAAAEVVGVLQGASRFIGLDAELDSRGTGNHTRNGSLRVAHEHADHASNECRSRDNARATAHIVAELDDFLNDD